MVRYIVGLIEQDREIYNQYARNCLRESRGSVTEAWALGCDDRLAAQYNRAIVEMLAHAEPADEPTVFLHPDVIILEEDFEEKVKRAFAKHRDVGLAGVLGATYLPANGNWWCADRKSRRGHLIQEYEGRGPRHMIQGRIGYSDDLVCLDGLCLIVRTSLLRDGLRFDPRFPNYLHTETDLCFSVLNAGYKVGVINVLLQHRSEGKRAYTMAWVDARKILMNKWLGDPDWKRPVTIAELANRCSPVAP